MIKLTTANNRDYNYEVYKGENCLINGTIQDQDLADVNLAAGSVIVTVLTSLTATASYTITAVLLTQNTYKGEFFANITPAMTTALGYGSFIVVITHTYTTNQVNILRAGLTIK